MSDATAGGRGTRPAFKANSARPQAALTGRLLGGPAAYGDFGVAARLAKLYRAVDISGLRVLDLGCGIGSYTVELARRAGWVCGLDVQQKHLASFRAQIPRVRALAETLPFAPETFDAVTLIEVLEHTRSDAAVLAECRRVLRPGGRLLLFVPNKLYPLESHPCFLGKNAIGYNIPFASWLPDSVRRHICHARIYSKRKLLALADLAGFQPEVVDYLYPPLDHFPLPFRSQYRALAGRLERTPLRVFGVSIFMVLRRS